MVSNLMVLLVSTDVQCVIFSFLFEGPHAWETSKHQQSFEFVFMLRSRVSRIRESNISVFDFYLSHIRTRTAGK